MEFNQLKESTIVSEEVINDFIKAVKGLTEILLDDNGNLADFSDKEKTEGLLAEIKFLKENIILFLNVANDLDTVDLKFWKYRSIYLDPHLLKYNGRVAVRLNSDVINECRKVISFLGLSGKVTLGGYVDNIISSHLRQHSDMLLKEMNKQSRKQISNSLKL